MAQVIGPWTRAYNSAGVILPAAQLRLYEAGTTTLATVYSDEALTVDHDNPITADGAGYFPQIFATEGLSFEVTTLAADGTTPIKEWGTWEAIGSQAGVIEYDFGPNGRVVIRGTGGLPNIEFGDPDPDELGGSGRIGGRAGTQADAIEIDAAATTMTGDAAIQGDLEVTGTMPADKYIDSGEETNQASIIIDLPAEYDAYELELSYISASAATSLEAFFSFDGTTYKTGADDYAWKITGDGAASDISDARLAWGGVSGSAMTNANPSRCTMFIDSIASKETGISGEVRLSNTDGSYAASVSQFVGTTRGKTYGKAQKIKLSGNTANIGFRWVLKAKKNAI